MTNEFLNIAEKFLKDTGTEFKAEFLRCDKHFADDKEPRDIYQITLKRAFKVGMPRVYSFEFGQSINATGEYIVYPDRLRLHKEAAKKYLKEKFGNYAAAGGEFNANTKRNKDFAASCGESDI